MTLGCTHIEVEVDLDEVVSDLSDEDILAIVEERGMTIGTAAAATRIEQHQRMIHVLTEINETFLAKDRSHFIVLIARAIGLAAEICGVPRQEAQLAAPAPALFDQDRSEEL